MQKDAYDGCSNEDLILRDRLAAARTELANERTFLAYVRTAMTLLVTGIFLAKFFDHTLAVLAGWASAPLGGLVLLLGVWRYRKMKAALARLREK